MENAGLIFVHPFLSTLFDRLSYLNDKREFKDEASRWKAVNVLNYIATGQVSFIDQSSNDMSRILCGMPVEYHVYPGLMISQNEKTVLIYCCCILYQNGKYWVIPVMRALEIHS
ncbi:MAG: contractile injection system tape measure protein [Bacteroidota bacterium]